MKQSLKQRLVGAIVLVALAVIFLPMLLSGPVDRGQVSVPVEIPPEPRVKPSSQLPEPDDETTTRPPPDSITEAPEPVDESSAGGGDEPDVAADDGDTTAGQEQAGEEQGAEEQAGEEQAAVEPEEEPSDAAVADSDAVPAQGGWAVQVGGFRNQSNALGLRDKLRGEGYTVYVDESEWKDEPLFRVRVGPVISEDEAESLKSRLKSDQNLDGIVVSR